MKCSFVKMATIAVVLLGAQLGPLQGQTDDGMVDVVASDKLLTNDKPSVSHLHAYKAWHHAIYLKATALW